MKILLATDGSEHSKGAARFLRCLRLTPEDEIIVFHALYWLPYLYDVESYYSTLREIKKDIAPRIIDAVIAELQPVAAKISTAIVDGPPEGYIVDACREAAADLVVMGARGIGGVESLFVGSVTRGVAVKSPVPVLVTRLPACDRTTGLRVLLASDGSANAGAALRFFLSLPLDEQTRVTVLHVVRSDFFDIPETFAPEVIERTIGLADEIREQRRSASKRILEEVRTVLGSRFREIPTLSVPGDAATEIIRAAESSGADLICLGCRGLRGIRGIMGSVSRSVLSHARCSVLIGRTCGE